MTRFEDLIDQLGLAKVLTTLDLARGYWQMKVKESDREKTAFTTPYGLYQFKVMPFGMNGEPAAFQELMDKVMRGTETYVGVYMDDVMVYSDIWEDHLRHLREVLERLRVAGLTAKPSKCQLGMSHCYYLGYMVGGVVIKPEQRKVDFVKKFPTPQTKKQVWTFLGLSGYYREFIPGYSVVAAELTTW